jgi:hypothetical protein
MRGSKAKALRTETTPNPGSKFGGQTKHSVRYSDKKRRLAELEARKNYVDKQLQKIKDRNDRRTSDD